MKKQKKPLVIIIGRSGAGKTSVANAMRDAYGWTQIESYTTRPRRSEDETGHHFITEARNVTALPTWNTADTATARNGNNLTRRIFTW